MESEKIHAEAIIVSDYSEKYSHWNAVESLGDMTWDLYWYSNSYALPEYLNTINNQVKGIWKL